VIQLEHYVQSKDLSAIHNEDIILAAAASELLAQADTIARSQQRFSVQPDGVLFTSDALHLVGRT